MDLETNNTHLKSETIQPINKETVHRICSGQVVLSLSIAVKELVENSIDSKANNIQIKLKDYGMELIEIIDNGSGVCKENFAALALKHCTSKIREFSDLETIGTLGFRGEALSSLCALSDITITTRHSTAEYATKIQYDHNGKIKSETPTARSQGTTVSLANLFNPLPVRRKEYVKNYKREFNKMCNLLYAYCLVSKGVKFSCSNLTKKGSSSSIVTTQGSKLIKENIVAVFGAKQISTLIEVELVTPNEAMAEEFSMKCCSGDPSAFEFEFFISSVVHGSGRSASDRQFYYINSRPCEPVKIMKLVNDVYRQFNSHQYPFVFLNIIVKDSLVDVNVTPDKRQIFLEKEKLLLATIKMTLMEAFKNFPSTFKIQNQSIAKGVKRELETTNGNILDLFRKKSKSEISSPHNKLESQNKTEIKSNGNLLLPLVKNKNEVVKENKVNLFNCYTQNKTSNSDITSNDDKDIGNGNDVMDIINESDSCIDAKNKVCGDKRGAMPGSHVEYNCEVEENISCNLNLVQVAKENIKALKKIDGIQTNKNDTEYVNSGTFRKHRKTVQFNISLKDIEKSIQSTFLNDKDSENDAVVKFHKTISPSKNQDAENELQRHITKDMFAKMKIIGQFNHAFIVVALNNDLFIIDQHATDEIYNFEELQRTYILESQPLVIPKDLQLTAADEDILIENIDLFKRNGFDFSIDEDAEATKKAKMTKIPISKSCIFGKDDVDEMLFMLQEGCADNNCRPSRVRGMFASRACRKSVMVGQPLAKNDMRKLVDHMGEIDKPWNCPHGRPTMRHLLNLTLIHKD